MTQPTEPSTTLGHTTTQATARFQQAVGDLHGKDEAYVEGFKCACALLGRLLIDLDDEDASQTVVRLVSVQH